MPPHLFMPLRGLEYLIIFFFFWEPRKLLNKSTQMRQLAHPTCNEARPRTAAASTTDMRSRTPWGGSAFTFQTIFKSSGDFIKPCLCAPSRNKKKLSPPPPKPNPTHSSSSPPGVDFCSRGPNYALIQTFFFASRN